MGVIADNIGYFEAFVLEHIRTLEGKECNMRMICEEVFL
jgi:hypothetical protein